jgi:hypothetical protein
LQAGFDAAKQALGEGCGQDGGLGGFALQALGVNEVASNDPQVFSQVVAFTFGRYQGQRRYLQIYTHGNGVFGIGTDSNQTDPGGRPLHEEKQQPDMTIPDFAEALRQGLKGRTLDAIYFRACLMGNIEALYELRGLTRYAIASEDASRSVDNSNLTMTRLFDDLAAKNTPPAEVARQMAIAGRGKRGMMSNSDPGGYRTIAAIEIDRLDELKGAINSLAKALLGADASHETAIRTAYSAAAVPPFSGYADDQRDLWAFTAALQKHVQDPAVLRAVDVVRMAQRAVMLHEKDAHGSLANGLSILMPKTNKEEERVGFLNFIRKSYQKTRFAKDCAWDKFLEKMLTSPTVNPNSKP